MKVFSRCFVLTILLTFFSSTSFAIQVTYNWEGVINGIDTRNGNLPFEAPFNPSFGEIVYGTISFNPELSGTFRSATHQLYSVTTSYTIDGFTFNQTETNPFTNYASVFNNDVSLNDGVTGYDQFQTGFTLIDFKPGYDIHGGIILRDSSATAFTSTALPRNLDNLSFDLTNWALWIHGAGGSELTAPSIEVYGSITNISLVPEPETYSMLLTGLGVLGFMARRRKNTQA